MFCQSVVSIASESSRSSFGISRLRFFILDILITNSNPLTETLALQGESTLKHGLGNYYNCVEMARYCYSALVKEEDKRNRISQNKLQTI